MEYSLIDLANIKMSFWEWFIVAFYIIFVAILRAGWRQERARHNYDSFVPRGTKTDGDSE